MTMMMMTMICRSMNSPNRRVASFWRMFYDSFLMFSNFNNGYLLFFLFFVAYVVFRAFWLLRVWLRVSLEVSEMICYTC